MNTTMIVRAVGDHPADGGSVDGLRSAASRPVDGVERAARGGLARRSVADSRRTAAWLGALSLIVVGLAIATGAEAARFGVRVVDTGGEPIAGASVCIGLEGNYNQFGTAFTDLDGYTKIVDVPSVPLVLTVSRTRFAGLRRGEPARGYDLVREITLSEGLPGPRCRAGSSIVANPPSIDVRDVAVADGAASTTLTPHVSGEPSHYRVARDESFEGADWRPFERVIALPGGLAGEPSVYLQMRRYAGSARNWLEARSDVVSVDLSGRDRSGRDD